MANMRRKYVSFYLEKNKNATLKFHDDIEISASYEWAVSVHLIRLWRHGVPPVEAPGHLPGPDQPLDSDLHFTCSHRLQMSAHPHHSSPHSAAVIGQGQLNPDPFHLFLCSVRIIAVGTVWAPSLHPALCGDENQVCPEEALQRLFLCPTEGTHVHILQDKPKTQAEAGLKCAISVKRVWKKLFWDQDFYLQELCYENKLFVDTQLNFFYLCFSLSKDASKLFVFKKWWRNDASFVIQL